jgi:MT0933-like antitoxin protein
MRMPDFKGLMNKARGLAGKHPDQVDKGVQKGEDLAENKLGSNYDGQIKKGGDYVEGSLGVNEPDRQPE